MIVGIVMWQLGIFNLGSTAVTSSGFPKIKPQLTSCKMTVNGDFSCLFTNGAGTAIIVNEQPALFTGAQECVDATAEPTAGTRVGVGDNFMVSSSGCSEGSPGEPYSVDVYIYYNVTVAGVQVSHNDTGKVKGPYEQV
ncbi:MAG: hypothetical protein V1703_04505 [Candidatus Altiarchaeota archaeon]